MRPTVPLAAALAAAVLGAAGCGGEDDSGAARALLERGFDAPIASAQVAISLTADLRGIPQQRQPVRIKLAGPYRSNGGARLPDADLDVTVSSGGQTFSLGLISTGDAAYLDFQGTSYRLEDATVQRLNGAGAPRAGEHPSGGLKERFGIDPLGWLRDLDQRDDADVAGVRTRHVRGTVDVGRLLRDLNRLVARVPGSAPGRPPAQLTDDQVDRARDAVDDPRLDVYVGAADGRIRRLSTDVEFEVPEKSRARVNGLREGRVSLDVELSAVGQPQRIVAPESSRPIAELTKQLGGLGVLGLLFGGSAGDRPGGPAGGRPVVPGGSTPTPEQFDRYSQCLERAKPSDIAAIERCSALLR
ncbi:MAG TPA: hypothetical protein VF520_08900 [Thermoleophilaceae bacterium]